MIRPKTTKIALAETQQAVNCGGLAAIVKMIKAVGLREELNRPPRSRTAKARKLHLPHDPTDHVLNIVLNLPVASRTPPRS
jgi:hypothetical protein